MRDNRPRAWYKPLGVMIPPEKVESINFETKVIGVYLEMDGRGYHKLRLSDFILMWPTHLSDRSGKEIYEGDIVREHAAGIHFDPDDYTIKVVEWWAFGWMPFARVIGGKMHDHAVMIRSYVVIGNIYEHPHLLGEKGEGQG